MVQEALSREIKSGYPEELLYADDLALVCETHEGLKGRLEACDWIWRQKWLVMKMLEGFAVKGDFPCAICKTCRQ